MYGAPYIFYFVHPIVKTVKMMVQRVNFERNLKNIRPATVHYTGKCFGFYLNLPSQDTKVGGFAQNQPFEPLFRPFLQ